MYGKIKNGVLVVLGPEVNVGTESAPNWVASDSASAASYRSANGWLTVVDNYEELGDGCVHKFNGATQSGNTIVRSFVSVNAAQAANEDIARSLKDANATTMTNSQKSTLLNRIAKVISGSVVACLAFCACAETALLGNLKDSDSVVTSVTNLETIVGSWENYWGGSNVCFEVTNYYGNTSGEIPRLRIKEYRDNEWKIVWDDRNKFDIWATNTLATCATNCAVALNSATNNLAPKAWGTLTDKGEPNVLSNSVWMTSPQTVFAGGTEYQRVAVGQGSICVLTTKGALSYTAGEAGTFRFQDDGGTNYFGFAKTDSYTIGCNASSIDVTGGIVTLRYDVIMGNGEVPIIYYTSTLPPVSWTQLNNVDGSACEGAPYTVTWGTLSTGVYLAHLNVGTAPQGFFRAETMVAGDVIFETNMKMRLDGGVLCTDGQTIIYPHANGTWSTTK